MERARQKQRAKHGGGRQREGWNEVGPLSDVRAGEILDVDAALDDLQAKDPNAAELVKLRFFVGLSNKEAAAAIGISTRSAERLWVYAKAWLRETLSN